MRLFRIALTFLVACTTVGLQAAPGPYILCAEICPVAGGSGEVVEIICWSGPSGTGCTIESSVSSCRDCESAPAIEDFGCCVADAVCLIGQGCPEPGECPIKGGDCLYCLPGRILANVSVESTSVDYYNSDVQSRATTILAAGDAAINSAHSHSPPRPQFATPGHDVCIEICLLLI